MESEICPVCGAMVKKENLKGHYERVHPKQAGSLVKTKTVVKTSWVSRSHRNRNIAILALVLVAVIGISIYVISSSSSSEYRQISVPGQTPSSLPDLGLDCDGSPCIHWHVHLDIFVNGTSKVVVPDTLGHIDNTGLYALHTHDTTGIIHYEGMPQGYSLGQIFEVWGYPQFDSSDCLLWHGQSVAVSLNGSPQASGSSLASIPLQQHQEFAIIIGEPPSTIPSTYAFPSGY